AASPPRHDARRPHPEEGTNHRGTETQRRKKRALRGFAGAGPGPWAPSLLALFFCLLCVSVPRWFAFLCPQIRNNRQISPPPPRRPPDGPARPHPPRRGGPKPRRVGSGSRARGGTFADPSRRGAMRPTTTAPGRALLVICLASAGWAFSFGVGAPLASLWLQR